MPTLLDRKDEQNLCDRNVTMSSKQGNARPI